jgi:hypothetical protein
LIRRFKTTVIREDEYIIEIDDEVIDEEWMKKYSEDFRNIPSLKGHIENLAWNRMVNGEDFYEGYGNVLHDGAIAWQATGYVEKGINIKVVNKDDIEVFAEEMLRI